MIERTADISVNIETCQNKLIESQDTLSKAYQDNLKNLTDTEIDDENLYICIVEPPGPAYTLAKVFSCPLWEIRSFNDRRYDTFPLVHAYAVSPVLGETFHICPSVECISSFSLSRPCEASHKINESGSTLLFT